MNIWPNFTEKPRKTVVLTGSNRTAEVFTTLPWQNWGAG